MRMISKFFHEIIWKNKNNLESFFKAYRTIFSLSTPIVFGVTLYFYIMLSVGSILLFNAGYLVFV